MRLFLKYTKLFEDSPILRRIGKNFSLGLGGSVLVLFFSLGQTALLTKNLPIEDYGRILVVLNFFGFFAMLLGLRVNDFIFRFFPQFKARQEYSELKGILFISFMLSFLVGLVIGLGVFFASSWIAQAFYNDPIYESLFRVYAIAAFFLAFEGFYTAILRLHDRFIFIVLPQVAGAAVSLVVIAGLVYTEKITLEFAVWAAAVGMIVKTLPALLLSFVYIKPAIKKVNGLGLYSLKKYRKHIVSVLFQTNLTGYLKLASDTGGMFLLGILATPGQVALYGIARQLAKALQIMQNNIQNALTPEIVSLWAKKNFKSLYNLVNTYTKWALVAGALIAAIAVLVSKPVILIFTTPEYLDALPVFYVFIFTIYLTFVSLVFFPLALAMDKVGRRNLIVSIRFIYLLLGILIGLNAMVLAIVQLLGVATVRLLNDLPLIRTLKNIGLKG